MMEKGKNEVWYDKSLEQIEKHFATDRGKGLTRSAAAKIRHENGYNNIYTTPESFSAKRMIPTDYASLLLLVTAVIAMIFDLPVAAGTIIMLLIINYAAALFTHFKAQKVLDGMTEYSLPTAKVMRDGKLMLVDMRALVVGDVIFFSAGDIIPADCRLIASDELYINESTLTGVQSSVFKDAEYAHFSPSLPLDMQKNMTFATTVVTAGNGRGIVVATAKDTAASRLGKAKTLATHENLKILSILKKYCSVWSLSMLALVFVITIINLFFLSSRGVFDVFLTGISLAAAAMSELYVAFGYIIVGCGIFGAMKRRRDVNIGALIKNAEKLEDLKNLTTLILPKDGVITSSHCVVEKIYASRKLYSADDADRIDRIRSTVLSGVISTGIYGAGLASLSGKSRKITSEEEAIIDLAQKLSLYNSQIDRSHPIIEHMPSGGASKFETTLTVDSGERYMAVCRGEVEAILNACEYYTENDRIFRMSPDDRLEFLNIASSLTRSSYRVVAVATGVTGYNNLQRIGSIQSDLTLEGFIAIHEPLQPGIAQAISRCKAAGVRVIMTSDKYSESDKYLAMSIGIIGDEKNILSSTKFESMNSDMLRTNLPLYNMYVGLDSLQIAQIIKHFQADGERVGLLTGGLNGALLLKRADVGFVQSVTISPKAKRTGIDIRTRSTPAYSRVAGGNTYECEALKLISDVVVSDADDSGNGGFAAVVSALEYARTIYKNLLRMVRYLTTTQLARIFAVLGSLIIGMNVLTPMQLVFGGVIIDLAAILASAFARPSHNALSIKDNAEETLKKPLMMNIRAVAFALLQAAAIMLINPVLSLAGAPLSQAEFSSAAFLAFTVCQLITFAELASERSIFRPGTRMSVSYLFFVGGTVLFLVLAFLVPSIGSLFDVVPLSWQALIASAAVSLVTLAVNEIYKLITRPDKS